MSYLAALHINTDKKHPYPYNVPAILAAKQIDLSNPVTFFIGENGSGKSTLLEAIAYRLRLTQMDQGGYIKKSYDAARSLLPYLELKWNIERSSGFFFRAEDFGDYMNSVHRVDVNLHNQMAEDLEDIPAHIMQQMKDSANYQLHSMRKKFGQEIDSFSHGEGYMHIMNQMVNRPGIYILDEPEAALSPSRQLELMYFIHQHCKKHPSQFIIATHSPMLMAYPDAAIYEITESGMTLTPLEKTDHFSITQSFLSNPQMYFRHLGI